MPRLTEEAREIAYPQLTKHQIDAVIGSLMGTLRDRELGASRKLNEDTLGYLIGFRTKRWGMPPQLGGREWEG